MEQNIDSNGIDIFEAEELSASLTVRDLSASIGWYCDILGFTPAKRFERDGRLFAARLKAGRVMILLVQDDGAKSLDRLKGDGFSLQFTTGQNIDEIAARIKKSGGILDSEPGDAPWGARFIRLHDPDGFKFTISTGIA